MALDLRLLLSLGLCPAPEESLHMADRHEPVEETRPLQSAPLAHRLGGGVAVAAVIVVILITTVAAAWFSTVLLAPTERPAPALTQEPAAEASTVGPVRLMQAVPRAGSSRQSKINQKPAPILAAPSSALPLASRKPAEDEVLVITVPKPGEGPVLSADDEGVTPPALVAPRANFPLQQTEGADDLSAIDLVISDKGEVESVKLASPVRDYREAMMLSAVKAWRFKPATVEGLPVRYKLRIHISVTSVAAAGR
jgi:hypothetical protein